MALYAIGDVQGCYGALRRLLDRVHFDPASDRVWFAGDLVNRGPDSLGTLRFIRSLGDAADSVLGNHDLHLIAAWYGHSEIHPKEGLGSIINAPDGEELINWLCQRPMLLESTVHRIALTHAGIPPCWSLADTRRLARELEQVLRSPQLPDFLGRMYGNKPTVWQEDLKGSKRLRLITNYFTRMRVCKPDGELEFHHKEGLDDIPEGYAPWYTYDNAGLEDYTVLFGHWAGLEGKTGRPGFEALDTGCVWGNALTALRVDDRQRFSYACQSGGAC